MKKQLLFAALGVATVGFISTQHQMNTEFGKYAHAFFGSGAPVGKTGAPTEGTCVDCHGGTAQSGATENLLGIAVGTTPSSTYIPGQVYNVGLTMSSSPSTKGFQAIALDGTNAMAGNFTTSTGIVQILTSGSKKYATHTANSNAPAGWAWQWTAPATNVGPVTFYVATNKSNGSGTGGDVIYTSTHVFNAASGVGIEEVANGSDSFEVGYATQSNSLVLSFSHPESAKMAVNVVDLSGKSVMFKRIGQSVVGDNNVKVELNTNLPAGIYVVHFFLDNKSMSKKIMIQ